MPNCSYTVYRDLEKECIIRLGLSLANGGPGINCLSETIYRYLCYGLQQGKIVTQVEQIEDDDVRKHLSKVKYN